LSGSRVGERVPCCVVLQAYALHTDSCTHARAACTCSVSTAL
jgi:hypothetical protein